MMMKSTLALSSSLSALLAFLLSANTVGGASLTDDQLFRAANTNCSTIMEIICDNDNELSTDTLCEAIQLAGLQDDLDTDTWTLFAPTNDAFDSLPDDVINSLLGGPTMDDTRGLIDLIAFHAVPGEEWNSTDLKCDGRIFMANEEYSVTICEGDRLYQVGVGNPTTNYPEITGATIEACNGIVHTISEVMLYEEIDGSTNTTTSSPTTADPLPPTPSPISIPFPPIPSPIDMPEFTQNPSSAPSTSAVPSTSTEPSDSMGPTTSERPTTSLYPSAAPSTEPSLSVKPSSAPSLTPSADPSNQPSFIASVEPSLSFEPTMEPSSSPSSAPTISPSISKLPTMKPSSEPSVGPEPCTITEIACDSDEFTHLCAAMKTTGLDDFFNDIDGNYTVFAPNDNAFENLGEVALAYLMDPANTNILTNILSFHTVSDQVIYSQDLNCMETLEMSNGWDSRTVCRRQALFQKGKGNSMFEKPEIIEVDIESCNGVIHVVDELILYKTQAELGLPPKAATFAPIPPKAATFAPTIAPVAASEATPTAAVTWSPSTPAPVVAQTLAPTPIPTIVPVPATCKTVDEVVCSDSDFSILCGSLESTGLARTLSIGTWTLFAPTNEAFLKLPAQYVQTLTSNPGVLARLLLFHAVAEEAIYESDLQCSAGENLLLMANGKNSRTLCMDTSPGVAVPIYQKGKFNSIDDLPEIVNFDMEACNDSVVHRLDGVMLYRPIVTEGSE